MKVVELFAGAGGMSQGAVNEGLDVVAAFDNWAPAIDTYSANFDHNATELDLADEKAVFSALDNFAADIVLGGPPCQDFSHAGQRSEGSRADLTVSFARYVARMKPSAFVMENVPAALRSDAYARARSLLKAGGYGLTEMVVDASLFNVPQRRKRAFVVGILGSQDGSVLSAVQAEQTVFPLSVRRGVSTISVEHYYRHPRSYDRRAVFSVDEPSPTIRGTNRPRPMNYSVHDKDSSSDPSVRALTLSERSAIQTFPAGYKWVGSTSLIEQMIGNAAPPTLVQAVIRATIGELSGGDRKNATALDILAAEMGSSRRVQNALALGRRLHRSLPLQRCESVASYQERLKRGPEYAQLEARQRASIDLLLSVQSNHEATTLIGA